MSGFLIRYRHSDRAIHALPFTKKIVDDILVWGSSLLELYERIRIIASRCDALNIVLSKKKFVIGNETSFAGLLLTEKGVKPDPARISCLHGLGYAMGHFVNGRFRVVACGSKSLTPTQQCYATIELECLGVHFAVDKGSFYLKGAPSFNVVTDHKPLEGIVKKDLFNVGNPRLQRIREKL